jgi:UDP-N-acetylglucosamine 1-carboxyvinyltransferase
VQRASLRVHGGRALHGALTVHSAKNSALYLVLASLLSDEPVVIEHLPRLSDVHVALDILAHLGVDVAWDGPHVTLRAHALTGHSAPYRLVSKMRASFVLMGALLARVGRARISMPGGCTFGPRPVDRHIAAFQSLGVTIQDEQGDFVAERAGVLSGRVVFEAPTVGGTQNIILASALGEGVVEIENAALEPEIADLCEMLTRMGAKIEGAGTPFIRIEGVPKLRGVRYRPIADRIEAGTFMLIAAATRSDIQLQNVRADHLSATIERLTEAGVRIVEMDRQTLRIDATGELTAVDITASEYPGLPTDLQAPFGAFLATVPGVSVVRDRVYVDRFTHVPELRKMGADAEVVDQTLIIRGGPLRGAEVFGADIRAGGALVVAALAATGVSSVYGRESIDRGYERLAERLTQAGARIEAMDAAPETAASPPFRVT